MKKMIDFVVIDDNKLDCYLAEKAIGASALAKSVITFTSAEEGLRHINATQSERMVVLAAIRMPLISGLQVIERIEAEHASHQELEICIISPLVTPIEERILKKYPDVHLIQKPLLPDHLRARFM
jgi:CheY-like chemotaxis protein